MLLVKIEDIEIRGYEVKQSRTTGRDYLVVRFEDVAGKSHSIVDRDMENRKYYNKGVQGYFYANLDMGKKYTNFEVSRFVVAGAANG